jgi:signal transduction histidine kinase
LSASRVAADGIIQAERRQLEELRFLIFSNGMAQAVYDHDAGQVEELMLGIMVNSSFDLAVALDAGGQEVLTMGRDGETGRIQKQQGHDYSALSIVQKTLGGPDEQGDKYAAVVTPPGGRPILFTSAPLKDAGGRQVGVMLAGTYLENVVAALGEQSLSEVMVLDDEGRLVAGTLSGNTAGFQALVDLAAGQPLTDQTLLYNTRLENAEHRVADGPFFIRDQRAGRMLVIRESQFLADKAKDIRNLVIGLFGTAALLMIVIGYLLAQHIARPLLRLREMSQAVAGGNLDQHIGLTRRDEIGDLGNAFDAMTGQLQERTAEAARLYAETVQRNIELKEINARLQSMQLQLIQSEKLASIGQLTAGIVHDVKNPFAVILGMAEVLADDENIDEATRHGLKVMETSARKGNAIVMDLLKFARQSTPELRARDLRETVESSILLTNYLTRPFNLSTELPDQPLMLTYDPQQIEQVLINMIHNAVQAMPNKGSLSVALKHVDGTAQISIQDTGCGITPEQQKRIFDPFFTTKPEGEGTGLGLSVSYGIIANHNGRIDVQSEVGKGTTFTIVLPIINPSIATGETSV